MPFLTSPLLDTATVRIVGVMDKSSAMMKTMMKVMKAPELMGTMTKMKMEMEKAGIIQDIMDDSLDAAMPVDEEEVCHFAEACMHSYSYTTLLTFLILLYAHAYHFP